MPPQETSSDYFLVDNYIIDRIDYDVVARVPDEILASTGRWSSGQTARGEPEWPRDWRPELRSLHRAGRPARVIWSGGP